MCLAEDIINRLKLIKYTLIVSIPAYFWEDLMDLVGSNANIEGDYYSGLLAMPIFIWANTLIIMICLVLDFFPKKIKSFLKKKWEPLKDTSDTILHLIK